MKYKSFFLTSIMVLLSSFKLFSQISECGATLSAEEFRSMVDFETANAELMRASIVSDEILYFPIRHHIIRRSNGTGGLSFSALDTIVEQLNAAYIVANIQFYSNGVDSIDSDDYYVFDWDGEPFLLSTYNSDSAINIYYCDTVKDINGIYAGYAKFPEQTPLPNNIIAISNLFATGNTVIHEMGHFFGLLHTFETSRGTKIELVNRDTVNCAYNGDLCCDTPADPRISSSTVNIDCVYTGDSVDANGDAYHPDTHNYMSYSPQKCRNKFSADQIYRIKKYSTNGRQGLITPPPILPPCPDCPTCSITINIHDTVYSATDVFDISDCSIEIANTTVESGATLNVTATESITLKPGFWAKPGSNVSLRIGQPMPPPIALYSDSDTGLDVHAPEANRAFDIRCYPNPFEGDVAFELTLRESAKISISVFDLNGALQKHLLSPTEYLVGTHTLTYHLSELKTGVYLCTINVGNKKSSVKLLKN